MGSSPGSLTATGPKVKAGGQFVATVADVAPMKAVAPFGECKSLKNPAVAAKIAAKTGTTAPCLPAPMGMWMPGCKKVKVSKIAALESGSTLSCAHQGTISVTNPGQQKVKGN